MRYAAWDARLSTPVRDTEGKVLGTERAHLEALARRGNANAIRELTPPEFPEVLSYLWKDRFLILHNMRAESINGLAAFTPEMLAAADRLFGWRLVPRETMALHFLDLAWRHPSAFDEAKAVQ